MRRSFGSIQQHKNGWRILWTTGGVRHSMLVHGTKQDALLELARIQVETSGVSRDMTWGEYWLLAVEPSIKDLELRTIEDYKRVWKRDLEPAIGSWYVSMTTSRQLEQVLSRFKGSVVEHNARLLRKVANMAYRDGLSQRPLMDGVRIKKSRRKEKDILDASEVYEFLKTIEGLKYEPVLLVELGGGLRHEEACALLWDDISFENGKAFLSISKALVVGSGGKYLKDTKTALSKRLVCVGEPFASRLLALKSKGPILPSGIGGKTVDRYSSPATMTHNWRVWCSKHNVRYIQPKNLRSCFATMHGEAGSPDSLVSMAMGHSDGTTKGRHYQVMTKRGGELIADNLAVYLESVNSVHE